MALTGPAYQRLVADVRFNLNGDIERRFQIGALVDQALAEGVTGQQFAKDVGVRWKTLADYHYTFLFWGQLRAKGTCTWSNYVWIAARVPDALANEAVTRIRKGADMAVVMKWLHRQIRADKRERVSSGEIAYNNLRMLRRTLAKALSESVSPEWQARVQAEIAGLVSDLEEVGALPKRRRRTAA